MASSKIRDVAFMALAQRDLSRDKDLKAGLLLIDFSVGAGIAQEFDFAYPEQIGLISGVLGLFIDNADNTFPLEIRMSGTQQRIVIPSACQAMLPLANKAPEKISFSSVGSAVIVPVQCLNFRPDPVVWGARSGGASPSAPMYVRDVTYNNMTWGNVALGASQQIVPAIPAGQIAIIKAPASNTNPAWLSWTGAAAANTTFQLDPGDCLIIGEPGNYDPRAITAFGTAPDRIAFGYV